MSLKHVLLITLQQGPMTGYELAKEFDTKSANFWQASHQQIYRELKKMAEADLIAGTEYIQQGKPDKKVYQVTPSGQQTLLKWLQQPCSEKLINSPFLAKFMAGECTDITAILADLERLTLEHEQTLAQFKQYLLKFPQPAHLPKAPKLVYLTLQRGLVMEQAWLDWAYQTKPELEAMLAQEQA
ncbi:PadR family transcriptional regulator [Motilimonas pumila]|uniref:PadR family transcriptional regulator n=1 Tax=Motilimonas pumila TaxID=2303987 RepID=A0A418YE43_9GAMM|nr:PadR family transcriptional regulator [Motilimonas pumila]RJG47418.1 PadR family transcriptional regulator [Motilimonas pumila]